MQFDAGASHNTESHNTLADGSDVVLDLDGRNGSQSLYAPSFPAARTRLRSAEAGSRRAPPEFGRVGWRAAFD